MEIIHKSKKYEKEIYPPIYEIISTRQHANTKNYKKLNEKIDL